MHINELLKEKEVDYESIYPIVKHAGPVMKIANEVAECLVGQGLDSDELANLGTKRAIKFIYYLANSLADEWSEGL